MQDLHTAIPLGAWLETGMDTQVLGYPQPRDRSHPKCCQNKSHKHRVCSLTAASWAHLCYRAVLFSCSFILQWSGSWPSRIHFCSPSPNREVKTAQAALNGGPSVSWTLLHNPTDGQSHGRTNAGTHSCRAVPVLLMEIPRLPPRMVSHSSNPSSSTQAVSMSNGLWMQQEKPAQPGRAVTLLHRTPNP